MQALIDLILRNLRELWPIRRVNAWQRGLLLRGGRIRRVYEPGLLWRVPFLDELYMWPANEVAIDLPSAAVLTEEGTSIEISANISYRMTDIRALYERLYYTDNSLKLIALGVIASRCAGKPLAAFGKDPATRERELLDALNAAVNDLGVEIVRLHLTTCVPTKAHRHLIDGALART